MSPNKPPVSADNKVEAASSQCRKNDETAIRVIQELLIQDKVKTAFRNFINELLEFYKQWNYEDIENYAAHIITLIMTWSPKAESLFLQNELENRILLKTMNMLERLANTLWITVWMLYNIGDMNKDDISSLIKEYPKRKFLYWILRRNGEALWLTNMTNDEIAAYAIALEMIDYNNQNITGDKLESALWHTSDVFRFVSKYFKFDDAPLDEVVEFLLKHNHIWLYMYTFCCPNIPLMERFQRLPKEEKEKIAAKIASKYLSEKKEYSRLSDNELLLSDHPIIERVKQFLGLKLFK